jgi:hypothetical protein
VADFNATGALSFSDVTPQEGVDAFSVMTIGTRYDDVSLVGAYSAPAGSTTTITAPVTMRKGGIPVGPVTVDIAGLSAGKYDAAELVVTDVAGIVATVDLSGLIGPATAQTQVQLPTGTDAASLGGTAVYTVSVRAWKRASPSASVQWARAASVVDLRSNASATVAITVP